MYTHTHVTLKCLLSRRALALLLLPLPLVAQSNLGRLVGTVRDGSGAVVPGAPVVVINEGTSLRRNFVSTASGDYEVSNLAAGVYTVTAEVSGFKKYVRNGVILDAGQTVRTDVTLEIGDVGQEIRVEDASPTVVESETASISSSIGYEAHVLSPLSDGNSPWGALTTLPNFRSGTSDFVYSIAGSRGAQNDFQVDGIGAPGGGAPQGSSAMTMEATKELKVQAVNSSAEYSQPGIYQQVSRGGTDQLHGSVRYYHDTTALNARNFFSASKAPSHSHKFGLWVAGPLVLPRLYNGRHRTFFMLGYDGALSPGSSNSNATVPTAAMQQGDFSAFGKTIKDPFSGQAFPNFRLPASRFSPASAKLQSMFYPAPNYGNPLVFSALNYRTLYDASGKSNNIDLRLDQKIADSNLFYARFGWIQYPARAWNAPEIGPNSQLRNLRNGVVSDTHIFTPQVINEWRMGFQRSNNRYRGPYKGLDVVKQIGLQGLKPGIPDGFGLPIMRITGLTTIFQTRQQVTLEQNYQMSDAITWIRGRHSFKGGTDIRRQYPGGGGIPDGTYGDFTFSGTYSGNAYSDFLLGLPQTSVRNYPAIPNRRRQWETGFFFQDDFKASPRVTLQLGLRYEYQTPTLNNDDLLYNFDPAAGRLVVPSELALKKVDPLFNPNIPIVVADGKSFPRGAVTTPDRNNFGPRIGVAFRPFGNGSFVIRSAYGIYYDKLGSGLAPGGGPFTVGSDRFTNRFVDGAPLFQFPLPFPDLAMGASTSPPKVNGIDVHLRNPYIQQWNFTIEREVRRTGLRASYIGTKGTQVLYGRNINRLPPSTVAYTQNRNVYPLYRDINVQSNGANSSYHALQLEGKRRLSDLTFDGSYTWSNDISDSGDSGNDYGDSIPNPYDRKSERGREAYTMQHRIVANAMWRIPVGRGRRFLGGAPAVVNHVVGGWNTLWTAFIESGYWFNPVFSGVDPSNTNTLGGRPDRIRNGRLDHPVLQRWFDPGAFVTPPPNAGRFGNSGNNVLEGPGARTLHLGISKEFTITEGLRLMMEGAGRNIFNHPSFGLPITDLSNPFVGQITSTRGGLQKMNSRSVQLRLRLSW